MTIRRREFITLLGGAATWPLAVKAQQPAKVWRVGMLETASPELNGANLSAFYKGLRELGYVAGQNLVIEYRSTDGRNERLPDFVSELIRLKVDLIVLRGTPQVLAVKNATSTIPVVMAAVANPVGLGIVADLAHPGGTITGLTSFVTEVEAKRIELLKEIVPGMRRVAAIWDSSNPTTAIQLEGQQTAARSLAIEITHLPVQNAADVSRAFEAAINERIDAIVVAIDTVTSTNRRQIVDLAARYRLPAIYASREFVDDGGLMTYGVSYPQLYYRAASFVDKILKGAKPADIPVEQPTKLELILNLKTAKALGLAIAPSVLARADEVIE